MTHTDPYASLRSGSFRLLLTATFLTVAAEQMLGVAIGWELYERTGSALALGLVGLVQVVPVILLALPAGHVVDRFDRRLVLVLSTVLIALSAMGLAVLSFAEGPLPLVYASLFLVGVGRAFGVPTSSALVSQVVVPEQYTNAVTWTSSVWQASSVVGPMVGGLLVAAFHGATPVYLIVAIGLVTAAVLTALMRTRPVARATEELSSESLLAGLRFVWNTKVILASITLDMFAVLLGGATALLPIYARDILHVGAAGLGLMRAAPSAGAILAAVIIAHRRPFIRAGWALLGSVAGFGLATIVFGLSTSLVLSLAMLLLLGGLDNVSVVIRNSLVLLSTPDDMRGRVGAVHFVFVGISNELGAFESGVAAAFLGAVGAVVLGGVGTILVVGVVAVIWPEVRRLRGLTLRELPVGGGSEQAVTVGEVAPVDPARADATDRG